MGVETCRLSAQRRHDVRMAMADRRDVVVDVEIGTALGIVEPHALAAHDMDGLGVEQPVGRAEKAPAAARSSPARCTGTSAALAGS